jgi:predicted membrane protein
MEPINTNTATPGRQGETTTAVERNRSGRVMGGLFIVAVGLLFLAKKAGVELPFWLFSFHTLLIGVGLYIGFRHSFRGIGWLIPVIIGATLLLDDIYPYYDISQFTWPIVIIGVGLFMIFRPGHRRRGRRNRRGTDSHPVDSTDDYIDSTVIFGGVKKNIISKNFRGGETVTIFGGTEINLLQADVTAPIRMDITQVFGGTKLIVPSDWTIQSKDLVAILGGVDDKRPLMNHPADATTNKLLILEGTCVLGGIDIRSY